MSSLQSQTANATRWSSITEVASRLSSMSPPEAAASVGKYGVSPSVDT